MDRTRPPPIVQVNIEGPSKARLGQRETDEGLEFTYIVALEGEYCVSVVYADYIHIPGSPFHPKFDSKSLENYALPLALRFLQLTAGPIIVCFRTQNVQ